MLVRLRKALRAVALAVVIALASVSTLSYCSQDDDGGGVGLLALLALAASGGTSCAPNSTSGFVVVLPCGVAQ